MFSKMKETKPVLIKMEKERQKGAGVEVDLRIQKCMVLHCKLSNTQCSFSSIPKKLRILLISEPNQQM